MMTTSERQQIEKPLRAHTKKQIRYAEILAKGIYSKADAARLAGYAESVADGRAYSWLGDTRESSEFPVLWDYYEKLRRKNLREFDITADNLSRELALIAFSDVTRFVDLPRKEYERKAAQAQATKDAIWAVEVYQNQMQAYSAAVAKQAQEDTQGGPKKGRPAEAPKEPAPPTFEQYRLIDAFAELSKDEQNDFMFWANYRAGSVRLKNAEEIPAALLPAIAEIAETKEGIKLKLHDKISALDKLARWRKMYAPDTGEDSEARVVTEINLVVNGSKSRLLSETDDQEEAVAESA